MKRYVVGFLFDETLQHVVLIKKNRPEWQRGLLNGVGGKIKGNEHPVTAMYREFKEETGMEVVEWQHVCALSSGVHLLDSCENPTNDDWTVMFFAGQHNQISTAETMTDEHVIVADWANNHVYKYNVIPNLEWLIPMAKECLKTGGFYEVQEG